MGERRVLPEWRKVQNLLTGTIVTCPVNGTFCGAVFVDESRPLYVMHRDLFRIQFYPNMTRSRHIRMEEYFEFGDVITFMGGNGFVLAITKIEQKFRECLGENNMLMIESICIFRYINEFDIEVYSTQFGNIQFDLKSAQGRPTANVAIRMYVNVQYIGPNECHFTAVRFKCIEPDDAPLVESAPWNRNRVARLAYDSDDGDDPIFGTPIKQGALYKKIGTVVDNDRSVTTDKYAVIVKCHTMPRDKFIVGFLKNEEINLQTGDQILFDAFWNEATNCYVVQEFEKRERR